MLDNKTLTQFGIQLDDEFPHPLAAIIQTGMNRIFSIGMTPMAASQGTAESVGTPYNNACYFGCTCSMVKSGSRSKSTVSPSQR